MHIPFMEELQRWIFIIALLPFDNFSQMTLEKTVNNYKHMHASEISQCSNNPRPDSKYYSGLRYNNATVVHLSFSYSLVVHVKFTTRNIILYEQ